MDSEEKVLEVLFENSNKEYHVRLLAKLTNLNPNTIINITDKLKKESLLTKQKDVDTNRVLIKAKIQDRYFKLKKKFYNTDKIYKSGLIEFLEEKLSYPTVILFGSYAKAENHVESDIDLFIICDEKIELDLNVFENVLNTKIQLFIHTKQEFKKMKTNNKELINNVLNGYIMTGYLEVL
ncbi:MAG: nucleotidyltransferase domain-containing protein [Nanoarchaeota archaeon]|nr:nucleotidyltransferase domain-containing protein [Nanoarchaeota archaeon]MBU1855322.1 nucleotidyltransferase domain-containing protein [Nanoarchaeota archaeon]